MIVIFALCILLWASLFAFFFFHKVLFKMNKYLMNIIVIGAAITLTGCATNQQSGQAIGAVTGAIVGNSVGGGAGKAAATFIGTVVGAEVGRNVGASMDRPATREVIIEREVQVVPAQSDVCRDIWNYKERQACYRGVSDRKHHEERLRIQEAYQRGRNGR